MMSWKPQCWRRYEVSVERWDSFRYIVQDTFGGDVVDEYGTDDEAERDRLVAGAADQGYKSNVITREN